MSKQSRLHRTFVKSLKTSITCLSAFKDNFFPVVSSAHEFNGSVFLLVEVCYLTKCHYTATVENRQGRVWIVKKEGGGQAAFSLKWHHGWIYRQARWCSSWGPNVPHAYLDLKRKDILIKGLCQGQQGKRVQYLYDHGIFPRLFLWKLQNMDTALQQIYPFYKSDVPFITENLHKDNTL